MSVVHQGRLVRSLISGFNEKIVIKSVESVIVCVSWLHKIKPMNFKTLLLLICSLPSLACAMGNPCDEGLTGDEKLLCNAKRTISVSLCEKGSSMEFRMNCVSAVRNRQRDELYGVKPMTAANTRIITSSPNKYFWMN